jgi:hypothetical protein
MVGCLAQAAENQPSKREALSAGGHRQNISSFALLGSEQALAARESPQANNCMCRLLEIWL